MHNRPNVGANRKRPTVKDNRCNALHKFSERELENWKFEMKKFESLVWIFHFTVRSSLITIFRHMFEHKTKIRTRYSEVDRMGYVYYGNYATYFEVGRVETMRMLGISYSELEKQGIMMPVIRYEIDYKKPAFYDEELTITTRVREVPRSRIQFEYETHNAKGELLNSAMTELVFVDSRTMKPQRAPQIIVDAAEKYL